jgi:hypothetical protein
MGSVTVLASVILNAGLSAVFFLSGTGMLFRKKAIFYPTFHVYL